MKALRIVGAAIGAVIVIIALLLVIGIPSGFLKGQIEERVERETGYKLAINGAAKIGLWPSLNITLNDVTLEDPKDRDINRRFAAGSIQADVTLASLWAGRPHVTELVVIRPVVNLPLRRERLREANTASQLAVAKASDAFSIEHVSVSGGTIIFSNLRDRVENRIETVNAEISIDADRKIQLSGNARSNGNPLKFEIKAAPPAPPIERQNIPAEIRIDAPGLLHAPLAAKAGVRLNGSVVMINGVTGTLGDGAFNGWASVDLSSKPLVKLDLDFQKLAVPMSRDATSTSAQPWSSATIDLNRLNYIDVQARISAAELNIGDGRFAPAAIDATLASGVLKAQVANLGVYDGNANGDLTIDASTANPTFAMRADLNGVRALPLLRSVADFDKLDGRMQAKISVRSSGTSQRAIMSNTAGTAFIVFQDGAIRGLNVAQMIRSLTSGTLSGWQDSEEKATDLSQLSASFRIDKGQAQTTDLNLVGPLVKMTGAGTIDLGTKQIGFRVEPKLVMTTEGQGRATDPVGLGIPVMIEGPWGAPRIYPEMQGILDNPEAAYAKLKEMGKGLFGPNGAGLGAAIGSLLGGGTRRHRWTGCGGRTGRRQPACEPARRDHRQSAAEGLERVGAELGSRRVATSGTAPGRPAQHPLGGIAGPGTGGAGADRTGRARRPRAAERGDGATGQPADE